MKSALVVLSVLALIAVSNAAITKFEWVDCGSTQVQFINFQLNPLPLVQLDQAELTLLANFLRGIRGKLRTEINIVRTISGLRLPVRCYLASGVYIGSCVYDDLCSLFAAIYPESFNPTNCPLEFTVNGIDCKCPFNNSPGSFQLSNAQLNFEELLNPFILFAISGTGDYEITIKTQDQAGPLACLLIKYNVKP